jgi:hypothetical protein
MDVYFQFFYFSRLSRPLHGLVNVTRELGKPFFDKVDSREKLCDQELQEKDDTLGFHPRRRRHLSRLRHHQSRFDASRLLYLPLLRQKGVGTSDLHSAL